jgi:hypothetical protein
VQTTFERADPVPLDDELLEKLQRHLWLNANPLQEAIASLQEKEKVQVLEPFVETMLALGPPEGVDPSLVSSPNWKGDCESAINWNDF